MNQPAQPWTELSAEEKCQAVLPLAKKKMSAQSIASNLNAPSRNAVITVIAKLQKRGDLPPTRQIASSRRATRKQKPAGAKPPIKRGRKAKLIGGVAQFTVATSTPKAAHANDFKGRAEQRAASPGLQLRAPRAFEPLPGVVPVPFGSSGCKWPVDGVNGKGLLVCGYARDNSERADEPYCVHHSRIAYTAPTYRPNASKRASERIPA